MYLPELRTRLSQGDIFAELELIDSAASISPPQRRNVIVLSHSCEIEKPSNCIVLVCAIRPLSSVDLGQRGHIQKNRVFNTMYIEPIAHLPESFIDFRYVFRVEKIFLEEGMRRGLRIASIDDETRLALGTFFYRFLTRRIPSTSESGIVNLIINSIKRTLRKFIKNKN